MLNLRVPVAITYLPRILNKRLPYGFINKGNQESFSCTFNNGNFRMVSFHQKLNDNQFSFNERHVLIKTYSTSTDFLKEKKLHQKIARKYKHITSSKLETEDSKPTKIPIQSESKESERTVNEIKIQTIETSSINLDKNVLTESSMPIAKSQLKPVTSKTDILVDILNSKKNTHSEQLMTNPMSTNQMASMSSHQVQYVDLSTIKVPIPLHENDKSLLESRTEESLDKIRYYTLRAEDAYLKGYEKGKIWYITIEEKLNSNRIYQEMLKENITKISILLTEKDTEKKVEKTVEKAKEISKSVGKIIYDKAKDLCAYSRGLLEKYKGKK